MRTFADIPDVTGPDGTAEGWRGRRRELLDQFARTEYGRRPDIDYALSSRTLRETAIDGLGAGGATGRVVELTVTTVLGSYSFPLYVFIPRAAEPVPAHVLICSQNRQVVPFRMPDGMKPEDIPAMMARLGVIMDAPLPMPHPRPLDMEHDMDNGHWPVPALMDRGHAVIGFYATDVEADDARAFPSGLARIFGTTPADGPGRKPDEWGVLSVWAFAASLALDWALGEPAIDPGNIGVIGHSRCGKAALWAGANDERFRCVTPNNSGCCGAALSRGKHGENLKSITMMFPHWFAPGFAAYADDPYALPFDQHQLLACVAPRLLYVTSASEDLWSDPAGEHEATVRASAAWGLYGYPALPPAMPEPDEPVSAGPVGYHVRRGAHLLTEYDWMRVVDHMERNRDARTEP